MQKTQNLTLKTVDDILSNNITSSKPRGKRESILSFQMSYDCAIMLNEIDNTFNEDSSDNDQVCKTKRLLDGDISLFFHQLKNQLKYYYSDESGFKRRLYVTAALMIEDYAEHIKIVNFSRCQSVDIKSEYEEEEEFRIRILFSESASIQAMNDINYFLLVLFTNNNSKSELRYSLESLTFELSLNYEHDYDCEYEPVHNMKMSVIGA